MAAVGSRLLTLADVAKNKRNPQIGKVAEVMVQQNQALLDMPYMVMNEGTIHKEEIRSSLPAVYYRKANQPIPASKSVTEERSFSAAHFESKSQMDLKVASRGGQQMVKYNRWNQAQGHIQAQAQELASLLVYGSPDSSTRKVAGLADVYSSLSASEPSSAQIINGGGSGSDNTSIWLIHWGEQSLFGIYPNDTTAGLKRSDNGVVQIIGTDENGNTGTFMGYEEVFETDHGLVVKDYRQAARICNIDISDLQGGSGDDLIESMIMASYKIDNPEQGKGCWYVNRTIEAFLHLQALNKVGAGGGITFQNFEGKQVMMFLGRPVRRMDAILNTESTIS
jgi:hypothetical protein